MAPAPQLPPDTLIALGGNAISRPGARMDLEAQFNQTREATDEIAGLLRDGLLGGVVMTHGNGPQIGFVLERSELAAPRLHRLSVDVAVADTQGGMGYMIMQCMDNSLRAAGVARSVASVVTRIRVDPADPALLEPTKYIGQSMSEEEAKRKAAESEWIVKEDPGRGWRRVIASPRPLEILEVDAIRALRDTGALVVAAGGGGIPVVRRDDGELRGIDGVIDKDFASARLALDLGTPLFLIITGADGVYSGWGTPDQRHYPELTAEALQRLHDAGQFPEGSMGPKVRAAIQYLREGGREVLITECGGIARALRGEGGTRVVP